MHDTITKAEVGRPTRTDAFPLEQRVNLIKAHRAMGVSGQQNPTIQDGSDFRSVVSYVNPTDPSSGTIVKSDRTDRVRGVSGVHSTV